MTSAIEAVGLFGYLILFSWLLAGGAVWLGAGADGFEFVLDRKKFMAAVRDYQITKGEAADLKAIQEAADYGRDTVGG